MARTALNAPAHRILQRIFTGAGALPREAAPSLDFLLSGLLDHRLTFDKFNSATGFQALGFWLGGPITLVNAVPSTIATANIAALANVTSGTAMTLVSTTGAGITVLGAATNFWPGSPVNGVPVPSGACVIDSVPTPLAFGVHDRSGFFDRTKMISRAVSITGVASGAGGAFTVRGYDVFGYPMSETITAGAGAGTTNGKKAFKAVTSVTPGFTDAHNYSVGTTDIYGFPLQCPLFSDAEIFWNNALVTSATGFVVPDATDPATATTGDVRGTYATQSASDGTKRLVMRVHASLALVNANPTTGLFGLPQFTN